MQFRLNTDGRGNDITSFVKRAGYLSSIYGTVHSLVDITLPETKRQLSKRDLRSGAISPYCTLILPTQLVDWSIDSSGELRWIIIKTLYYRDDDPRVERSVEYHYKLITRDSWEIEDEDGNPVSFPDGTPNKGTNELGIIPLATMYHSDIDNNLVGESLIKDIVYINRAILNWCSCIDEQIDRQTFSQLTVPDDGTLAERAESGDDPLFEIGTGSIFTFPAESGQPPRFISPDTNNINTIWKIVIDHIKEIFRLAGLIGGTGDLYVSRSGKASQIGFQSVNSALAEKASSYQKFENDISKLAYMYLNKNVDDYELVKYPSSFDVAALSDEIDSFFKVMQAEFSPTLNKTIQKNIARRAVPLASQSVRKAIEDEIESGDGTIKPVSISDNPKNDVGNPNVSSISDTNRSVQDKIDDEKKKQKKE